MGGALFRYALPFGIETPAEVWDGGKLWAYGGQEVFAERESCSNGHEYFEWVDDLPESVDSSIWDRVVGTELVDKLGRVWIVVDLDELALSQATSTAPAAPEAPEEFPGEDRAVSAAPGGHLEHGIAYDLFDYTTDDCSGDGDDDLFLRGADSRTAVANPMTTYERKAVLIVYDPGGGSIGTCSGVMVDQNSVLTAAHCVQDENGVPVSALHLDVCTYGNVQTSADCWQVPSFVRPPNAGTGQIEHDYALVSIGTNQDAGVGWMAISTATHSYIEARTGHNVGYPTYNGSCGRLDTSNVVDTSVPVGKFGRYQSIDTVNVTTNLIKTNADASVAQSGSPIYYFNSGSSGSHYVSGVVASFVDVWPPGGNNDYLGGPNHDQIYDWVDSNK